MGRMQEVGWMNLTRTMIAGVALAVFAIGLFLLLWFALGALGMTQATRLFAALCLPPVILGGVLLAYVLIKRPSGSDDTRAS
jgi:hypothetical protein